MKKKNKTTKTKPLKSRRLSKTDPAAFNLWVKAAGRCEFKGCNKILYEEELTHAGGNFANMAHILPHSAKGPRGDEITTETPEDRNKEENYILVCQEHHDLIDSPAGCKNYPRERLEEMKKQHEDRIRLVTGIQAPCTSRVVIYQTAIGNEPPFIISDDEANAAILPEKYPLEKDATHLSSVAMTPDTSIYAWREREKDLLAQFQAKLSPSIQKDRNAHISLFSLAPIPLLVQLGALLSKANVTFYHPRLNTKGWKWRKRASKKLNFTVKRPKGRHHQKVALILSISGTITPDRVTSVLGEDCSIWEIAVDEAFRNADSITTLAQLEKWGVKVASVIDEIKATHRYSKEICIFPAIPVPCALELGRRRFNKADLPWVMYDQNEKLNRFIKTITIKTK